MSNIRVGDKVIIGHISIPGLYIDPGTIGEIDAFAPRPSSDVRIKVLEGTRKGKGFWVDRKTGNQDMTNDNFIAYSNIRHS